MIDGHSIYSERPLQSDDEIRILTLHPARFNWSAIECSLSVHQRTAVPEYVAVSYTWGNPRREKGVTCCGHQLAVTANCTAALRALRNVAFDGSAAPRIIWIDAICINQDDVAERSVQVSRMGDTFANASETTIYLGEPDSHSDKMTEILRDFATHLDPNSSLGIWRSIWDDVWGQSKRSLEAVFQRPWFRRTWIIQEVLRSANLSVQIGHQNHSWDDLVQMLRPVCGRDMAALGAPMSSRRLPKNAPSIPEIMLLQVDHNGGADKAVFSDEFDATDSKSTHQGFRHRTLLDLLKTTRRFECQDPRDRLYAILPLLQDSAAPPSLRPDYAKQVCDVYLDLSTFLLDFDYEEVLALAQYTQVRTDKHRLPTWVVSWLNVPSRHAIAEQRKILGVGNVFGRCSFRTSENRLIVRGLVMDTVKEVLVAPQAAKQPPWYSINSGRASISSDDGGIDITWSGATRRGLRRAPTGTIDLGGPPVGSWTFFVTHNDFQGVAAMNEVAGKSVRVGDRICMFLGCQTPFLLRATRLKPNELSLAGERVEWSLVGECTFVNKNRDLAISRLETQWFEDFSRLSEAEIYGEKPVAILQDFAIR